MSLFAELKRRNVFRVAVGYIVSCWLLAQVADLVLDTIGAPDWAMKAIMLVFVLGFPVAVFFSWAYEVTPEGLKRESEVDRSQSITHITARKLDWAILATLAVALAFYAYDRLVLMPEREALLAVAANSDVAADGTENRAVDSDPDKSIAVLPFVNMSSDAEQDYFSDGLSEELLNLLAKIPGLRVAARTSSFSFKGQNLEIPEIGQRLNVAHILEGSVRKSGDQVRVTAQLVKADDGFHLWSETYDRTLDNIFAIQDEIATSVVRQMKVTLLGAGPVVQETDPQAYALFLQARELGRQNSRESIVRSITLYQQVLALDSEYAAAWSGLATNYTQQAAVGLRTAEEGFTLAREAAENALAIDPEFAPAHGNLGYIALAFDGDLTTAARHLERALDREPGNLDILRIAAELYRGLGRIKKALAVCEYMLRLDPVNNNSYYLLGVISRFDGRIDESIAAFQTALSLSPGRVAAWASIGEGLMLKGDLEAALEAAEQEESVWRMIVLPMVYYAMGKTAESDAALAELIAEEERGAAVNIASIYAFRGEADRAFEWLEKAVLYQDPGLTDLPIEGLFANIHDDPRWLLLLERIGRAPAQLDAIHFEVRLPD